MTDVDLRAVHRNMGHESGSIDVDDVTAATLHVGTVETPLTDGHLLGSIALPSGTRGTYNTAAMLAGRYAVLPKSGSTHADVVNANDPAHPVVVATFSPHTANAVWQDAVALSDGSHVALCTYAQNAAPTSLFEVWDLSNPAVPAYVASLAGAHVDQPEPLAVMGTLLVGGPSSNWDAVDPLLIVFDLTTPASPALLAHLALPAVGGHANFSLSGLCPLDSTTVALGTIADGGGNLYIVDLTTPASPALLSSLHVPSMLWTLAVLDATHLVALSPDADTGGLLVLDISTRSSPQARGSVPVPHAYWPLINPDLPLCYVLGQQGTGAGLHTVDLSDVTAPRLVGVLPVTPGLPLPLPSSQALLYCNDGYARTVALPTAVLPSQAASLGAGAATIGGPVQVESLSSDGPLSGTTGTFGGAVTAHGNPVPEAGAITAETITPDKTITLTINGVNYKVPAVLA